MKKFLSIILCFSFLFSFHIRSYAKVDDPYDLATQLIKITGDDWYKYLRIETERSLLAQIFEMEEFNNFNFPNKNFTVVGKFYGVQGAKADEFSVVTERNAKIYRWKAIVYDPFTFKMKVFDFPNYVIRKKKDEGDIMDNRTGYSLIPRNLFLIPQWVAYIDPDSSGDGSVSAEEILYRRLEQGVYLMNLYKLGTQKKTID